MSVHILTDADNERAVLICSTSGQAFGPVISEQGYEDAQEQAQMFLESLVDDARHYSADELTALYHSWRKDSRCVGCMSGLATQQCDRAHMTCRDCLEQDGDGPDVSERCRMCDAEDDDAQEALEDSRAEWREENPW